MQGFDALGKKINQIESYIDECIKKIGANYGEFAILYTLAKDGQSTQKRVADEWCMPKQSVFNIAKDLRARNLISVSQGERDKREQIMSLTPSGERRRNFYALAPRRIRRYSDVSARRIASFFLSS